MYENFSFQIVSFQVLSQNIQKFLYLEELTNLNPHWREENFLIDLPKKYDYSIMLVEKDEILGYIICSQKNDFIHINRFIIDTNIARKGLGTILLNKFVDIVKNSYSTISLKVLKSSEAVNFYKKNCFKITNEIGEYYHMERVINE